MNEKKISAEQAVYDLTLALLYLTRFKEGGESRKISFSGPGKAMTGTPWTSSVKKNLQLTDMGTRACI